MPVGTPPHRPADADPGRERRFELCRAAVQGDERFDVSRLEVEREGPSESDLSELAGLRLAERFRGYGPEELGVRAALVVARTSS